MLRHAWLPHLARPTRHAAATTKTITATDFFLEALLHLCDQKYIGSDRSATSATTSGRTQCTRDSFEGEPNRGPAPLGVMGTSNSTVDVLCNVTVAQKKPCARRGV